ncbi:MAG: hypothetical protein KIT02_14275 [Devosia sp.]|uniref:hypothetical protein n=1 Tax=Devosia sp. TaxID=1871048 RepID=UPI0024CB2EE0|nr:hypothetical protein [Devosia sp.]UYN99080.1 MAG: hypothetical protein KIT02_14275 [Devosia sp.]
MGFDRAKILIMLTLAASPALAFEPGWHPSPLAGEGDRASMGCPAAAEGVEQACIIVRCEDDYSTGIHIQSGRWPGAEGNWHLTLDREDRTIAAIADAGPYSARLVDGDGWLLDGLLHGTFVYLRHAEDIDGPYQQITLEGSFRAIGEALYWCAPRVPRGEQNAPPGVDPESQQGEPQ